ncbi:MAG: hypothetical protein ACR2PX_24565 [Endozoicomonas sp.]|uniref:hypothetical protein n=1 Tax=Endozoicomonas sp. TaxID=1892382 RepID=UPI003D9B7D77
MKKIISLHADLISEALLIAERENFIEAIAILKSYSEGQLSLSNRNAQILMNMLIFEGYRVSLCYPFADEESDNYNEDHADAQDDYYYGLYIKLSSELEVHFDIVRTGQKV